MSRDLKGEEDLVLGIAIELSAGLQGPKRQLRGRTPKTDVMREACWLKELYETII
jgi:hypothetical protein